MRGRAAFHSDTIHSASPTLESDNPASPVYMGFGESGVNGWAPSTSGP